MQINVDNRPMLFIFTSCSHPRGAVKSCTFVPCCDPGWCSQPAGISHSTVKHTQPESQLIMVFCRWHTVWYHAGGHNWALNKQQDGWDYRTCSSMLG